LADFPVDQGQVFASASAQAKYVWEPVGNLGSTVVALSQPAALTLTIEEMSTGLASPTEAQTLMVIDGFVWRVDEGYYAGGISRVSVATVVFVVDVPTRAVVHVELIGVDIPGGTTSNAHGIMLEAAARAYVADPQVTAVLKIPESVGEFQRATDALVGGRDGDPFRSSAAVNLYTTDQSGGPQFTYWGMSRVQADRLGITMVPDDEVTRELLAGTADNSSTYSSGAHGGVLRCGTFGDEPSCAWADAQSIGKIIPWAAPDLGVAGLADLANDLRDLLD